MRKSSCCLLVLLLLTLSVAGFAQNRVLGKAEIPFGFRVHEQTFEAGTYQLRQISYQAMRLESVKTLEGVTLISPQPITMERTATLEFRGPAGRRFLTDISAGGYEIQLNWTEVDTTLKASKETTKIVMKSGM